MNEALDSFLDYGPAEEHEEVAAEEASQRTKRHIQSLSHTAAQHPPTHTNTSPNALAADKMYLLFNL